MLIGFKARFREPIIKGTKIFTLRQIGKRPPRMGDQLYMYTGLRTKSCENIPGNYCIKRLHIVDITVSRNVFHELMTEIWIGKKLLTEDQVKDFVIYDGFRNVKDFCEYWINSTYAPRKAPTECTVGGQMNLIGWEEFEL